jgi:hypothetical protein
LKPSQSPATREVGAVACDLTAFGWVRASVGELSQLRRQPGPVWGEPLPASFLKHADEQTVAGLAAVYHAIHDHHLGETPFADWGVLAAPYHQGRAALAAALLRFHEEGAWGVSPHLIPHRSLHSMSGMVSLALKIHGPNFGVGGGPGAAQEALLAALALLKRQQLPGVWVILGALEGNRAPTPQGDPDPGSVWVGQALALRSARPEWTGIRLRLARSTGQPEGSGMALDPFRLNDALAQLSAAAEPGRTISLVLDAGLQLDLCRAGTLDGVSVARLNGTAALHPPHVNGKAYHPVPPDKVTR